MRGRMYKCKWERGSNNIERESNNTERGNNRWEGMSSNY